MPSLSRLLHSKSILKLGSKFFGSCMQSGSDVERANTSKAELIDLRERVNAAQDALTQLDVLLGALQGDVDEASAVRYHPIDPSSPVVKSIAIDLQDLKRSTENLARTIRKHAPTPSDVPICAPLAAVPKSTSGAPLRLPLRDPSTPAAPTTDIDHPSPFDQEICLLDSQLRQHYSLDSIVPRPKISAKRPISLPISTFDKKIFHTAHSLHFSTKAKTQKLRSMQQDEPRLDEERPLSMDELLQFLRKGNSMREL